MTYIRMIIAAFMDSQGLELVVQNLKRLDESNEEESDGVSSTYTLLEHVFEVSPTITSTICAHTNILESLVDRVKVKSFAPNKLHASEILSILLTSSSSVGIANDQGLDNTSSSSGSSSSSSSSSSSNTNNNITLALSITGSFDIVDSLLQAVSYYRKHPPETQDDEECLHNIALSLAMLLTNTTGLERFLKSDGVELLVVCLKARTSCALSAAALKTLSFGARVPSICNKLIEEGGLKYVFPFFLGKGFSKKNAKGIVDTTYKSADKLVSLKHTITVVYMLCIHMYADTANDAGSRLLAKFQEHDFMKTDRCVELFMVYRKKVLNTEEVRSIETLNNFGGLCSCIMAIISNTGWYSSQRT